MNLTERERLLIVECLQRMDPDTLNDDLDAPTSGIELDEIAEKVRAL